MVRSYAQELLGRQEVQALLDTIKKQHPQLVRDLLPDRFSLGEIQKILQDLVREGVSIRSLEPALNIGRRAIWLWHRAVVFWPRLGPAKPPTA